MLKRWMTTIIVIAAFAVLVALINVFEPNRLSVRQAEEAAAVEEQILKAEEVEAELARKAAEEAALIAADAPEGETADVELEAGTIVLEMETSKGTIELHLHAEWSPLGVMQFIAAMDAGVYDDARFFRVIPGFVAQFGIPGNPELAMEWEARTIPDEPVEKSNVRGTLSFAKPDLPNSRSTQVFINLQDNSGTLDEMGFSAIGHVTKGMDIVDTINGEHLQSPDQGMIKTRGNAYLNEFFPDLDYVKLITVTEVAPMEEEAQ